MPVVQPSCFAICIFSGLFHSSYLPMSHRLCWITRTCLIRLPGVYSFLIRRISRWWCTMYIASGWIICWLHHRGLFKCTDCSQITMAQVDPFLQVVRSGLVLVLNSSTLGDIVESGPRVGSHQIISWYRQSSEYGCANYWLYLRQGQWTRIWKNLQAASGGILEPWDTGLKARKLRLAYHINCHGAPCQQQGRSKIQSTGGQFSL